MIARLWQGIARIESCEAYIEHLEADTFPGLRSMPGFVSASILQRQIGEGVEMLIETRWQSRESIRAFAGDDIGAAVVPLKVRDMMVTYDTIVRHYTIVE